MRREGIDRIPLQSVRYMYIVLWQGASTYVGNGLHLRYFLFLFLNRLAIGGVCFIFIMFAFIFIMFDRIKLRELPVKNYYTVESCYYFTKSRCSRCGIIVHSIPWEGTICMNILCRRPE